MNYYDVTFNSVWDSLSGIGCSLSGTSRTKYRHNTQVLAESAAEALSKAIETISKGWKAIETWETSVKQIADNE